MTPLEAAAHEYAARGWPVFPCRAGRKEPATPHGFKDATTDQERIRRWWSRHPDANVAIATGAPGPDVLDVDVKADGNGFGAFDRLKRAGLLAGAVALVRTRSGGLHAYFAGTDQGCRGLRRHFLDFKAAGGYVLAPPSIVEGRPYELLDWRHVGRPLDWPTVARLLDPPRPAPWPRRSGRAGVQALAAWLERQPDHVNDALYWAACRAAEAGSTEDDCAALVEAAIRAASEWPAEQVRRDSERTVRSALKRQGVLT
jgi:hypothetical protein